ncbi:helix-turn-helix domain-containing protein [Ruegeria arenilitoris]|uniref:AraC-like ligand-binding domain-containing protein n=1 Tax=Ruegeria arenilitoris TaxID=1173585 RepID=UPI00148026A7|nr:AraC family transcriptional regulator [Ruegeria arenilitoris]
MNQLSAIPEPLKSYRMFRSSNVNVARHAVGQKFGSHDLQIQGGRYPFVARYNHAPGERLSLNYLSYGSAVEIEPGELIHYYQVQLPWEGRAEIFSGQERVVSAPQTAVVLNPVRKVRMIWREGCEQLLLHIHRNALHTAAERMLGCHLPQPVLFRARMPLTSSAKKVWSQKLLTSFQIAERNLAFNGTKSRRQTLMEEELITGLLLAHESSISPLLRLMGNGSPNPLVKRATRFMIDNLSEEMSISQIAQDAGCSVRTIQTAFRERMSCTPMQFLQSARLNYAHYLLHSAPKDKLVRNIAYEAGFSHLGRFSIAYRKAFGTRPGTVLTAETNAADR